VFDTPVLVTISSIGIFCTLLMEYCISAAMVLQIPKDLMVEEEPMGGIF
jgi:hypothetical protein